MNEQELLADCLRRLNRSGITYYLTILTTELELLLTGKIRPKQT